MNRSFPESRPWTASPPWTASREAISSLADVLEPMGTRRSDLAFADTELGSDLDALDRDTPFAFPLSPAPPDKAFAPGLVRGTLVLVSVFLAAAALGALTVGASALAAGDATAAEVVRGPRTRERLAHVTSIVVRVRGKAR